MLYNCPSYQLLLQIRSVKRQNNDASNGDDEEAISNISYTISVFSLTEQKKAQNRRKPESSLLELSSDIEWIDAKARFKIIISNLLFRD